VPKPAASSKPVDKASTPNQVVHVFWADTSSLRVFKSTDACSQCSSEFLVREYPTHELRRRRLFRRRLEVGSKGDSPIRDTHSISLPLIAFLNFMQSQPTPATAAPAAKPNSTASNPKPVTTGLLTGLSWGDLSEQWSLEEAENDASLVDLRIATGLICCVTGSTSLQTLVVEMQIPLQSQWLTQHQSRRP
jgi:hypothetical protein